MGTKYFIIIICLLIHSHCFSQTGDSSFCNRQNSRIDTTVSTFIKGKKGADKIIWRFFYKEFELKLSDPSFEIVKFTITWDDRRKDMLVQRINKGKNVKPDLENSDLPNKQNYSLKNIAPGTIITFDNILVKKDGECFRIRPFLIYTTI